MFNNKITSSFPIQTTSSFPLQSTSSFPIQSTSTFPLQSTSTFPMQTTSSFPLQSTSSFPIQSTSTFPMQTTSTFPMQTTSTFPSNEFNIYFIIEKQFLQMKSLSIFTESQNMKSSDFEGINSISVESIEKLGELSIIYIKNSSNDKLKIMFEKHLELIKKIIKFNNIYSEISLNIKQLASLDLTEDEKRFTFVDIFYRYKLQLYEIISDIKILIAII